MVGCMYDRVVGWGRTGYIGQEGCRGWGRIDEQFSVGRCRMYSIGRGYIGANLQRIISGTKKNVSWEGRFHCN